jgi:hypothetical protein
MQGDATMTKHLTGWLTAAVLGVAMISSAHAGRFPGPGQDTAVIAPLDDISYTDRYVGLESAVVRVNGDGSTLLKAEVFDDAGNLIDSDVGFNCTLRWTPIFTGKFTVVVTNLGFERNVYHLRSN